MFSKYAGALLLSMISAFFFWYGSIPSTCCQFVLDGPAEPGVKRTNITIKSTVFYEPYQSGMIRVLSDYCLNFVSVNGMPVMGSWPNNPPSCEENAISLDVLPYMHKGSNDLELQMGADGHREKHIRIQPVHHWFSMVMLVASLAVGAYTFFNLAAPFAFVYRAPLAVSIVMLVPAVLIKLHYIDFVSGDVRAGYGPWLSHIQNAGLDKAYATLFSNYAPLYMYIMGLTDALFPFKEPLYIIKLASMFGEMVAAYFTYKLIAFYKPSARFLPLIAAYSIFLCPAVIANGASASQCDIWYTSFIIGSVYAMAVRKPKSALAYFGTAFSLKLQAIFVAPFMFIFVLNRRIPLIHCWIFPAMYLLFVIPSWLEGRSFMDLIGIYWGQVHYGTAGGNAGNIYALMSDHAAEMFMPFALVLAAIISLVFSFVTARRWNDEQDKTAYLLLVTLCATFIPFLLPRMLDRYFFTAEVLGWVLAFARPRYIGIAIMLQIGALFPYPTWQFPNADIWTGIEDSWRRTLSCLLNFTSMLWLCWFCCKEAWHCKRRATIV